LLTLGVELTGKLEKKQTGSGKKRMQDRKTERKKTEKVDAKTCAEYL
jgi:hypothetical protein